MTRKFMLVVILLSMLVGIVQLTEAMQAGAARKTVWDGVFADAQASRGQAVYTQYCLGMSQHKPWRSSGAGGPAAQGPQIHGELARRQFGQPVDQDQDNDASTGSQESEPNRGSRSCRLVMQANEFPAGSELNANKLGTIPIQRTDGPKPLPNYAIVQVLGCLAQDNDNWILTNVGSRPESATPKSRSLRSSSCRKQAAWRGHIFACRTWRCSVDFNADAHKGHRMTTKRAYSKQANMDRVSVAELEMIGSGCGE